MSNPESQSAPARFACILQALWKTLASVSAKRGIPASDAWGYLNYIKRLKDRFAEIVAMLEAGTLPPFRPRLPRVAQAARAEGEVRPARTPPAQKIPRKFAWLIDLAQETAGHGSQLHYLLRDPEMRALLERAPQLASVLRPLLNMLAVTMGPDLPPQLAPRQNPRAEAAEAANAEAAVPRKRTRTRPASAKPLSLAVPWPEPEPQRRGGRRRREKFTYSPGAERYSIA